MYYNICLIGLPTSGKTTFGRILSKKLKKGFIDTDEIIKYKYNCNLKDLIDIKNQHNFLKIENNLVKSLHCENTIISTGGSMVYNFESINHIKNNLNSKIINLELSNKEFNKRKYKFINRGVINPNNLEFEEFYMERIKLGKKHSDYNIIVDNKKNALKKIIEIINNY